jgi:hypothetical protein
MCRRGTNAYAHHLDFQYNNFGDAFFIVKKWPFLVNLCLNHCRKYFLSQCSTSFVGMQFCTYVSNSPSNKKFT